MNLELKKFIVFNIEDGRGEGSEHEKLLFHWTKDAIDNKIDLAEQIDDVCMCDATITASDRLSSGISTTDQHGVSHILNSEIGDILAETLDQEDVFKSIVITFQPTVVVIVEVEAIQSIWIAVHVSPCDSNDNNQQQNPSTFSESIPSEAIKQVIRSIYLRFCLLNGTFRMIADEAVQSGSHESNPRTIIRERIRQICQDYFHVALPEIHLTSLLSNIASLYNYLVYLDLNSLTLMKVVSFVNHLVSIDPTQILQTITIFNDQLIWSSLNETNTRLVYNYLIAVLIKDALQEELIRETEKVRSIVDDLPLYLVDDSDESEPLLANMKSDKASFKIDGSKRLKKRYLTVYRSSNNLTIGLILKDARQLELKQKCEQMLLSDIRLGVIPLASLAKLVGQNFIRTSAVTQAGISNSTISSASSKRRNSNSSANYLKTNPPSDHRYLSIDHLSLSVSSFLNVDTQARDNASLKQLDSAGAETSCSKKLRFIKYLLDLEPELQQILHRTGNRVQEHLARTTNDVWLAVLNSRYRSVYSLYKLRNAGLSEARESAINLRSSLIMNRL